MVGAFETMKEERVLGRRCCVEKNQERDGAWLTSNPTQAPNPLSFHSQKYQGSQRSDICCVTLDWFLTLLEPFSKYVTWIEFLEKPPCPPPHPQPSQHPEWDVRRNSLAQWFWEGKERKGQGRARGRGRGSGRGGAERRKLMPEVQQGGTGLGRGPLLSSPLLSPGALRSDLPSLWM